MRPQERIDILSNKKARFNYSVLESIEAGIKLVGPEIKSIRQKDVNFNDAYIDIVNDECFLVGFYIGTYKNCHYEIPDTLRDRKLLLKKREIQILKEKREKKGMTLIPLDIYFKGSWVKLNIGICKGKKQHDKREDLKKKSIERDMRNEY